MIDADDFQAALRWPGADLPREGVHREGAELLVATRVIAGEWQGHLAEQFGLAGMVSAEDFAKLSQGQHPQTGEQLVRQRASYEYQDADGKTVKTMEHRAGWDATFSAPKSVSLTALVGGDDRVREAHRESVRVALDQLEHYTQARIGGNHPPETTGKFIAAKFEHDTARPVDGYVAPQLHTHAVVFNVTERDNGQPRAIQPQSLFASQQFATASLSIRVDLQTAPTRIRNYDRAGAARRRSRAIHRNTSTHPVPAANRSVSTSNAPAARGRRLPRSPRTRRGIARRFIRPER